VSQAYEQFLRKQYAGFAVDPGSWLSVNLALATVGYVPDFSTDVNLASIGAGNLAADGMTGTFPTFTLNFNGTGAAPEAGIRLTLLTGSWGAIAAGPDVNAAVLYAILAAGDQVLLAYYNDWTGLPFTPNGSVVSISSLPTPLQANGVNMLRSVPITT
jgi:hypothetical protein